MAWLKYIVKLGGLEQKSAVQNSQPLWQDFNIKNPARTTENSGQHFSGLDPQFYYISQLLFLQERNVQRDGDPWSVQPWFYNHQT